VKKQFRAFANSLPELCWMRTAMAGFSGVTRGGTSTRERSRSKWRERARGRCTMQKMLPLVLERWKASVEGGTAFEMEFPLRGADGVYRWFPEPDSTSSG